MSLEESNAKQVEQAEALLPELKIELGEAAQGISDKDLLRFLYWKADVKRAAGRFRDHIKWRQENKWAFDDPELKVSTDEQLQKLLKDQILVAPDSLTSKDGCAVVIGRLKNNDMSDGRKPVDICRMFLYIIDRVMERKEAQLNGVILFHDLDGVSKNNLDFRIPKILFPAIIGHFPIRIKGIYMLNAPFFFKGMFAVISNLLLPKKIKQRAHTVKSIDEIYGRVDKDELLLEHGGQLDFNVEEWVDKNKQREVENKVDSFHSCLVHAVSSVSC